MTEASQFEREAISQLSALHHFAHQLCRDEHYSHDLVQETLLKACRYFHAYREGTNCRAWLFQICKNSYINSYRRRQLEPISVCFQEESVDRGTDSDEVRTFRVSPHDDSDVKKLRSCMSDEVVSALHALPHEYQTAVILSDIEGHTYEEIANFMQIPVGTIRSRIHRGRKLLAAHLTGYAKSLGWSVATKAAC